MGQASKNSGRDLGKTSLINRNVWVNGRRTSIRLEKEMWEALHAIADAERVSINDLCSAVYEARKDDESFSSAIRVFLLNYYRSSVHMGAAAPLELVARARTVLQALPNSEEGHHVESE